MTPKEMRTQRVKLWEDMKKLNAKAVEEKRQLTAEERQQWDTMDSEVNLLKERIDNEERLLGLDDEFKRNPMGDTRSDGNPAPRENAAAVSPGEALRAWCLAETDSITDEMRQNAKACKLDLHSKELRIKLPKRAPKNLREAEAHLREMEQRGTSNQSVGTTTLGGFTVATDTSMYSAIEVALLQFGGMRAVSTVLRTETGADMPIPTVNDTTTTGAILAENTAVTTGDVTFAQVTLQAFKYSSLKVLVSVELMQDAAVDMDALLGRLLGERLGRITNTHYTTGTGSGQPNGVVTAGTSAGLTATTGVVGKFVYADLVDMIHSVDPAYRVGGNVGFMMRDSSLAVARKIVDSQSRPIWEPNVQAGDPDRLLGYPVFINQDVAATALNAKSLLFGNFSKYIIRDVRDITFLRLNERYADLHQVGFLAFMRSDGDLLDAGTRPVKYFTGAAS